MILFLTFVHYTEDPKDYTAGGEKTMMRMIIWRITCSSDLLEEKEIIRMLNDLHFCNFTEVDDKEPNVDFMTNLGMNAEVSLNHFFTLLGESKRVHFYFL